MTGIGLKKGMRVLAYQVDGERTDIATLEEWDECLYYVTADCGDQYGTEQICPISPLEEVLLLEGRKLV